MKQALVIATCVLLFASPALAQPATPIDHLLPAAEDLGPGWVKLTSTLPTADPTYPEERGLLAAGQAALIPAMVPHGIRNIGDETARCVGFFAAAEVVSTFDHPMMPLGQQVVGTPPVGAPMH